METFQGTSSFSASFEELPYSSISIFPFNCRHFRGNSCTSYYILFDSCSLQIQNLHEQNIKASSWLHTCVIFHINWGLRVKRSLLTHLQSATGENLLLYTCTFPLDLLIILTAFKTSSAGLFHLSLSVVLLLKISPSGLQ